MPGPEEQPLTHSQNTCALCEEKQDSIQLLITAQAHSYIRRHLLRANLQRWSGAVQSTELHEARHQLLQLAFTRRNVSAFSEVISNILHTHQPTSVRTSLCGHLRMGSAGATPPQHLGIQRGISSHPTACPKPSPKEYCCLAQP